MLKKYSKLFLILIFIGALFLRWLYLPAGAITFGYDQGRDAFIAQQIIGGHLKILGPPVGGLPGIFHGVFYYYVITPAYFFGHGNPIVVAYWMSFLNALGVFLVWAFVRSITNKEAPSLISALIYAVSFEATQYANWLSNPSLGIIFVPMIYFGLWLWLKKNNKFAPIITGLSLGLSIQCNTALAYHILPVVVWLYFCRSLINRKTLTIFFFSFILSTLTMIVSEIKFSGGGLSGLWYLFSSQDKIAASTQLGGFVVNYLDQIGRVFSFTLFPLSTVFGGLVGLITSLVVLISWLKEKNREFVSWQPIILSAPIAYIFALSFGGGSTPHITVGVASLISIMTGILIWKISENNKILATVLFLIILLSNIIKIISENKNGQTNFAIQKGLVLSKELEAVDYTYVNSDTKPFSVSTLTSPLFVNTTWSYLYNWYGKDKYGYLPYWIGKDQIGQLGNNLKSISNNDHFFLLPHYFIMEPTYSIPDLYIGYARGEQDSISNLESQANFGTIVVQKRIIKNNVKK